MSAISRVLIVLPLPQNFDLYLSEGEAAAAPACVSTSESVDLIRRVATLKTAFIFFLHGFCSYLTALQPFSPHNVFPLPTIFLHNATNT